MAVEPQATLDPGEPVIRLEDVTRTYQMGEVLVHALRGVDLDLRRDECTVLLGPSGSGKSTLMNVIGGLDLPTSGSVWFGGTDLTRAAPAVRTRFRREHVGFVFQFYNLLPSLTARENVQLVTDIAAQPMSPEDALALVGLEARLDHCPAVSSSGSRSPVRSRSDRRSCSVTNRPDRSTSRPAGRCSRPSSGPRPSSRPARC